MKLNKSSESELFNFFENCSSNSILIISGPKATGKSLLKILIREYLPVPLGIRFIEINSNEPISSNNPEVFVINLMEPIAKMFPFYEVTEEFLEYMRQHGVNV
jgi:predicted AAA+ superfamily ATPase